MCAKGLSGRAHGEAPSGRGDAAIAREIKLTHDVATTEASASPLGNSAFRVANLVFASH